MNIAFTTILLFIILAPGFIARSAYNSSKLSVNDTNKNIVNELTWSIIPSLTLHTLFIGIVHNLSSYFIDFQQLGNLILGVTTSNKAEECLDFKDVPDKYEEITDKIIYVLCKVNGKSILYTGEFFNYYIDSKGDLEAVHLRNPIRRELDKDGGKEEDYYVIASRYLVIPNTDIININFRYFSLEEVAEPTDEEKGNAITLDKA